MTFFLLAALAIIALTLLFRAMLTASPAAIAGFLRGGSIAILGLGGIVATALGRVGLGTLLLGFAGTLYSRFFKGIRSTPSEGKKSVVRGDYVEMELDHDTGEVQGRVIAGTFADRMLGELSEGELIKLLEEVGDDRDSSSLVEVYLDREFAGWRERHDAAAGDRQAASSGSGAMGEQEAYEILGLEPGATAVEIRQAHRRLMQRVHPDVGGSAALAARINAAKDVLLLRHR